MKLRQPYQPSIAGELGSFRPKVDSPDDVSPDDIGYSTKDEMLF